MRGKSQSNTHTRRLRRVLREARLPAPYLRLQRLAAEVDFATIEEAVAILARARTIKSTRKNPDGWIFLDNIVRIMLDFAEGGIPLPPDHED